MIVISDLYSLLRPPYIYLVFAFISFSAGVVSTCTGIACSRGGWAYRAKEPTQFWWTVVLYFLGGVFFIGYFLHKIHALSN